jgi:hypothetical protein
MSTHVYGLTVSMLADASRAARTVDHAVTVFDDATHTIVRCEPRGGARRGGCRGDRGNPGAGVWHRQVELLAQARSMLDWRRAVARRGSSDAAAAIP